MENIIDSDEEVYAEELKKLKKNKKRQRDTKKLIFPKFKEKIIPITKKRKFIII